MFLWKWGLWRFYRDGTYVVYFIVQVSNDRSTEIHGKRRPVSGILQVSLYIGPTSCYGRVSPV